MTNQLMFRMIDDSHLYAHAENVFSKHLPTSLEGKDSCKNWIGGCNADGYGTFKIRLDGRRVNIFAHRFACFMRHGEIPEGLEVMHSCDNPRCVNLHHLTLGTHAENIQDCIDKGRHFSAKLSIDQAIEIKSSPMNREQTAKKFGISHQTVRVIREGIIWKSLSDIDVTAKKVTHFLTENQARQIKFCGLSAKETAKKFGVAINTVWGIRRGDRWSHLMADGI